LCRADWTTATHCSSAWPTTCSNGYRAFRMRQRVLSLAPAAMSILRQYFVGSIGSRSGNVSSSWRCWSIYKSLLGQLPPYLADDCQLIADSGRRTLRWSDTAMFVVRRTNSTFGDRVSLSLDPWSGTVSRPLCAQPTCPLNGSNGHWRRFCLFETAARLWLFCLRRAGYKFSDIYTYTHTYIRVYTCLIFTANVVRPD